MTYQTSAPGKIMIAGEYAVLFGYPAVAMPSAQHAHCEFVRAPLFKLISHAGIDCDHSLFAAVFDACRAAAIEPLAGIYTVDTTSFFDRVSNHKLGLGSSAAAIVALTKMVLKQYDINNDTTLMNVAQNAHRNFSSGLGSGADIATCVSATPICFTRVENEYIVDRIINTDIFSRLVVVATRSPQCSRDFIRQSLAYNQRAPNVVERFCQHSSRLVTGLLSSKENEAIAIIDKLFHLLTDFGTASGIGIVIPAHEDIHRIAKEHHGSAKPSGAGGGDIAIAIVPAQNQESFMQALLAENYLVL